MPLNLTIDSVESVAEPLREFYKQSGDKFVLDIAEGAIPKADYDAKVAEYDALKAVAYAEDGEAYKDKFAGSQTANKAIRQERDNFSAELKKFKAIGEVSDISGWKDELDALRAKGASLNDLQQQITELKKEKRGFETKVEELTNLKKTVDAENAELKSYKDKMTKQLDLTDAENKISAVVDAIPGARARALKRLLLDRYKDGTLTRDKAGNLATAENGTALGDFAKEMMEDYGLVQDTKGGLSNPTGHGGFNPGGTSGNTQTTPEYLSSLFH